VKELNEMTLGRTDDPENPLGAQACQSRRSVWGWIADPIWASGHAPREKAGHMIAIDPPVRFLIFPLASKGPPTHAPTPFLAQGERSLPYRGRLTRISHKAKVRRAANAKI
jgi:hypothetical protein